MYIKYEVKENDCIKAMTIILLETFVYIFIYHFIFHRMFSDFFLDWKCATCKRAYAIVYQKMAVLFVQEIKVQIFKLHKPAK